MYEFIDEFKSEQNIGDGEIDINSLMW
jgi:hypothetical protein